MNHSFFPNDSERFHMGRVALGLEAPDFILHGAKYLNVYTREFLDGDIWISGRFIARISTDICKFTTKIIDVSGKFLAPGFVEGHIHVESSLADPVTFSQAALRCGVTSVFTDFHEVGAVAGRPGIKEMCEALRETDVKALFITPPQLPFLPELQHTLSTLNTVEALDLLNEDESVGLAEVNGQEIVKTLKNGDANDLALFDKAVRQRKTPEGHLFLTRGEELDACLAVGISSDHEPRKQEEVIEKIRKGVFVMLRNGTIAREVETLVGVIARENLPTDRVGLVTDDMMISHMTSDDYMLHKVRLAVKSGIPVPEALRMVSYNIAEHYRLGELIGTLRSGSYADILVFDSPETLQLERVIASGHPIPLKSEPSKTKRTYSPELLHTILRPPLTKEELQFIPKDYQDEEVTIRSIEMNQINRFTELVEVPVKVKNGDADLSSSDENLFYLICANRQRKDLLGKAFLKDYGLKNGAIAVSQAHDHHGIVALGRSKEDLLVAANRVIELQGGIVLVQNGQITEELPLPVAGLMSDLPMEETISRIHDIEDKLRNGGVKWYQPLFFLFWLGMEVAPFFRITDRGLFDTEEEKVISCIVGGKQVD
ncbi:MAG: adenine deaminase C-terminal domain-containing protein [Spirochaetales bacterium]|nr:adenine deaminase C-terminal domain-containing protein [Spirochaetales bacterium]